MHKKRTTGICLAIIATALLLLSCKGAMKTVSSEPEPEPEPGKRDYTWYLAPLDMPMNVVSYVWGATPDDVWAGGEGGTEYDRLWHYDGTTWSKYPDAIWCTGQTMYGFGNNDVWMAGGVWYNHDGGIWHYDGTTWKENYMFNVDSAYGVGINSIWGYSSKDIYASGTITYKDNENGTYRGFILHYNGKQWQEIYRADFESQFIRIRGYENIPYILSYDLKQDLFIVFQLNGKTLKEISPDGVPANAYYEFYLINGKMYFRKGRNVYLYTGGGAFELKFNVTDNNFSYILGGRHEKDIFLCMKDGIAHYNGEDIQYLCNYPDNIMGVYEGIFFEKEIFAPFMGRNSWDNYILQGILNE